MIYRAEPQTLMIFNAVKGITATISGNELHILKNYLENGHKNEFISRLSDLELLPTAISEDRRQNILKEIEKTESVTSPPCSFAVPESIHIDLTTTCPLACVQCYKNTSQDTEMSFEIFSKIIDQAKDMGVFQIAIGGGEPLAVKHLPIFIRKVTLYGMACTITTSGYGLTLELIEEMKASGVNHIQISLNGSTKAINSCSRDGFDKVVSALEMLSKNDVLFGINWVARMDNVNDFENMITLAKILKADNINILRYKPSDREDYGKISLTNDAFLFLVSKIRKVRGLKIKVDSAFSNLLCYIYGNQLNPMNCGCGAGRRFMMVDAHGRFKPCSHLSLVSEEQDLLRYWQNSPDLAKLRECEADIDGECKSCWYLNVCRGCRAICEKIHDNINAGEKNCPVYMEKELI